MKQQTTQQVASQNQQAQSQQESLVSAVDSAVSSSPSQSPSVQRKVSGRVASEKKQAAAVASSNLHMPRVAPAVSAMGSMASADEGFGPMSAFGAPLAYPNHHFAFMHHMNMASGYPMDIGPESPVGHQGMVRLRPPPRGGGGACTTTTTAINLGEWGIQFYEPQGFQPSTTYRTTTPVSPEPKYQSSSGPSYRESKYTQQSQSAQG